jgi:HD-GYP domain-containing protein (c-di-GMP phosphodiesterase class II)
MAPSSSDQEGRRARDGAPARLADPLAALSLVTDLGFGLPPESALRSCVLATALARRLGLDETEVADVYWTALLEHVGCTGFAHEVAQRYGDELVVGAAVARTDTTDPRDLFATFLPAVTAGRGRLAWIRVALMELTSGARAARQYATAACEVGSATAQRLGLPAGVQRGLHEVYEAWNGSGGARGLKGDAITLPARIAQLAATAAHFESLGGPELALGAVRKQAGGALDPELARAFEASAPELLDAAAADDLHAAALDAEPEPARTVPAGRLADVAAAFGDIADLKSPYLLGHSSGVANLAIEAARRAGMSTADVERVHVAALLHDIGRVGISDSVWDRPASLGGAQWEQVRLHAYHSERILARSAALRDLAPLAGMHHERLDGSGYHRGTRARDIPIAVRILAAADAYRAMTQARAYRPALEPDEAAGRLRADVEAGRLDRDAVRAVLDVAGQHAPRARAALPAGLSDREVEVLRLVSRGFTNRQIAEQFTISPRTAEHHVQHIYTKLGVSSRAAAAIFAMEHDLLEPNG